MKRLFWILILVLPGAAAADARDVGKYNVEELTSDEGDPKKKPFTITGIEQQRGQLFIWINAEYGGITGIARQISNKKLEAQVSDSENATAVTLTLNKEIACNNAWGKDAGTYRLGYAAPLPAACKAVKTIKYYLIAPVTLKTSNDLGIGLEPYYLWLIEIK